MKRTLSIILAIVTVLSTAVFAAPVTVGTVETANEATYVSDQDNTALIAAEDDYFVAPEGESANGSLVFHAHFNNVTASAPYKGTMENYGVWGEKYAADSGASIGGAFKLSAGDTDKLRSSWDNEGNTVTAEDDEFMIERSVATTSGETWPKLAVNTDGRFVDGVYTFCAEVSFVPDAGVVSATFNPFVTTTTGGWAQKTGTKRSIAVDGSKQYITTSMIIYSGKVYDASNMTLMGSVDMKSIYEAGFNFNVVMASGRTEATTLRICADNFRMYYKPYDAYFTAPENEAEASDLVFHAHFNNSAVDPLGQSVDNFGNYGDLSLLSSVIQGEGGTDIKFSLYDAWNCTTTSWGTSANSSLTADDDELLLASTFGSNLYPALLATVDNGSYFADGKYTFFTEYYIQKGENITGITYTYFLKYGESYHTGADQYKIALDVSGEKAYISLEVFVYDGDIYIWNSDGELKNVGSFPKKTDTAIGMLFHLKGNGTSATTRIYLDNLRMYYKPLDATPGKANIYFDANGMEADDLPETQSEVAWGTYDIANAGTLSDIGTTRFVGWATSKDGKVVEGSFDLKESTTLYAIWDENYYASSKEAQGSNLVFNAHFNNYASSANGAAINSFGTYGNGLSEAVVGTDSNVYLSLQSATAKWGSDVHAGVSKADDEFIVEKGRTGAGEMWPIFVAQLKNGSKFADGKYTLCAEISMSDNEAVDWFKYSYYVKGKMSGKDGYHTGGGEYKVSVALGGEKNYITMELFLHGGKLYAYHNNGTLVNVGSLDDKSVYEIGFLFNPHSTSSTTTHISVDNFRMYYSGMYKPASYNENCIRVSDPAGIRFKASVTDFIRNDSELVEYGFIVTRKVILDNLGIAAESFDMTIDTDAYVKGITKGVDNGKEVDRIFAKEGINTFITAVVYNVPADKYSDVLVVRPFVTVGDETVYGNVMQASILEVAQKLKTSENYENYKTVVDKILAGEEI